MARKYKSDRIESCASAVPTKADRKEAIRRVKRTIARYNKHLDALANMTQSYDYNQNTLAELIGTATIQLSNAKEQLKGLKNGK